MSNMQAYKINTHRLVQLVDKTKETLMLNRKVSGLVVLLGLALAALHSSSGALTADKTSDWSRPSPDASSVLTVQPCLAGWQCLVPYLGIKKFDPKHLKSMITMSYTNITGSHMSNYRKFCLNKAIFLHYLYVGGPRWSLRLRLLYYE